jgi:hypothetical protein
MSPLAAISAAGAGKAIICAEYDSPAAKDTDVRGILGSLGHSSLYRAQHGPAYGTVANVEGQSYILYFHFD